MKKVDPILIPELNRLAENQRVNTNITPAGDLVCRDFSYKKGHDIPEGYYLVKLVGIKCHGPTCYYMDLEVLQDAFSLEEFPEPKGIKGYGERRCSDFSDLASCFSSGVVHKRSTGYVGSYGVVWLTHSGWIKLLSRDALGVLLPGFKSEHIECDDSKIGFSEGYPCKFPPD